MMIFRLLLICSVVVIGYCLTLISAQSTKSPTKKPTSTPTQAPTGSPTSSYDIGTCFPQNYTLIAPQTGWCTISKSNFHTIYEVCSSTITGVDDPVTSDLGECSPISDGANCITKLRSYYCSINCLECESGKTQSPLRVCQSTCQAVKDACPNMLANSDCAPLFASMTIYCADTGVTPCTDVASGNGPSPTAYPTIAPTGNDKPSGSISAFSASSSLIITITLYCTYLITSMVVIS